MENDENIEEIKQKRLAELKQRFTEKQMEEQKALEQEAQLEAITRKLLEPQAKARLANVRLVNKELYFKAIQAILYLAQQGRIEGKLNDAQAKRLLERLQGAKREIRIVRK